MMGEENQLLQVVFWPLNIYQWSTRTCMCAYTQTVTSTKNERTIFFLHLSSSYPVKFPKPPPPVNFSHRAMDWARAEGDLRLPAGPPLLRLCSLNNWWAWYSTTSSHACYTPEGKHAGCDCACLLPNPRALYRNCIILGHVSIKYNTLIYKLKMIATLPHRPLGGSNKPHNTGHLAPHLSNTKPNAANCSVFLPKCIGAWAWRTLLWLSRPNSARGDEGQQQFWMFTTPKRIHLSGQLKLIPCWLPLY